ncbi:alpha/beta fold hydrolase [Novosphingobium resinovorum]
MVHGSESSLRTWDRIALALKGRYRIIRYDIPGYGLSDGATDAAAKTMQPTDIPVELLTRLGVKKLTFVGVSSGGTMGMYLAARRPDLVERLILSNTPSDPVDTSHLVMPKSFTDATERAKQTGFRDQTFWNEFLSYFAGDAARISAQTRKEYYDFYRRTPEKNLIALVARIGDGKQATVEMAKVRKPTFLIWGAADHLLPESAANAIARYLKNAQISRVMMPDVGHYPPLEVPERFAQLIAAYVEAGTPICLRKPPLPEAGTRARLVTGREALARDPPAEFLEPMVGRAAGLLHAETVAAPLIQVGFGPVAAGEQGIVERPEAIAHRHVILRHGQEQRRQAARRGLGRRLQPGIAGRAFRIGKVRGRDFRQLRAERHAVDQPGEIGPHSLGSKSHHARDMTARREADDTDALGIDAVLGRA